MKRLFFLLLSISIMTSALYADNGNNVPDLTEEQIKLLQNRLFSGPHRSVQSEPLAFLNTLSGTIRVEYFSEYEVDMFIINSTGEIVITAVMDAYAPGHMIEAPMIPGNYLLVMKSPEMYAEGVFTIQ